MLDAVGAPAVVTVQVALAEARERDAFRLRPAREHPELDLDDIAVIVDQGTVRLEGRVGTEAELRMADHVDDQALARVAATEQLSVRPLSAYCLQRRDARGLVLGYGYAPLAQIPSSGAQLARLLMRSLRSP